MGLMAGASDLFLAMPSGGYHGFFVELKAPSKKPTMLQLEFMDKVRQHGYWSDWFDDWLKAKVNIIEYLAMAKPAA